jgi:hypothetical protein
MKDESLKDFFLVGGTALALQIGHRISIDLDLFSRKSFDGNDMLSYLERQYSFQMDYQANNTLKGSIKDIKVDFITHDYPLVNDLINMDQVRMASMEDIAAMKLNAISGNGTRIKDFIDIAYLSSSLTLSKMVEAYEKKYNSRNPAMVVKALDYHSDINFNEPIEIIGDGFNWANIEKRLREMTLNPTRLFKIIPNRKQIQQRMPSKNEENKGPKK